MSESLGYASGSLKMGDLENANGIVDKQRKELGLLLQELKDRDTELNEMVMAHKDQLRAWELDRKRALFFENKSKKLKGGYSIFCKFLHYFIEFLDDLEKKNSLLHGYLTELKLSETKHNSKDIALETSQVGND